jgi:hypothetical protein
LAQEDLWVIEALLRVIKKTNEDAKGPSDATVKVVEALEIGKDAVAAWKTSAASVVSNAGEAPGGPGPSGPGGPPGAAAPGPPAPGGPPGANARDLLIEQLMEGRYVDNNGDPLPAGAPHDEFKMMPVHMRLTIREERLPKLLVECGNSSMPIEIRQVMPMAPAPEVLDISAAAAAQAMKGGKGGSRGGMKPPASSPHGHASDTPDAGLYDIPVDLFGIIYIYNPPDRQKLGAAEKTAEPGAPGAAQAPPPSAPATPAPATAAPAAPNPQDFGK